MQSQEPTLSVIIPCLNEAASIPVMIPHLLTCILNWEKAGISQVEIIVVDDGSSDDSPALLKAFNQVLVLRNPQSLGYGGALKRGFQAAKGKYITFFDLDRTYDPIDVEPLLKTLIKNNLSIVFGDRMSQNNQMPRTRRLGNFLYAKVINILYGKELKDVCTGLRVFHKDLLSEILKASENDLSFTIAFTTLMLNKKVPFAQIPIRYDERIGHSKLSVVNDGFKFLFTIFKYFRQKPRDF